MKTIAVDFDGVIHRYMEGWKDGTIYDEPVQGVHNSLQTLTDKGYQVVIFTCRANNWTTPDDPVEIQKIVDWLNKHHFYEGAHYHKVTGIKPIAKFYIDDRAIRFATWDKALLDINRYEHYT